jgi:hypothetical protein
VSENQDPPELGGPPPAPVMPRRVRLYRAQWLGLPLLLVLPLLGLAGAFGESRQTRTFADEFVRVEVDYPVRLRVRQPSAVHVRVDRLADMADSLLIAVDPAWLDRFAKVTVIPEPQHGWSVWLRDPHPGSRAEVRVEFEARQLWSGRGRIHIQHAGGVGHVEITTFVYP